MIRRLFTLVCWAVGGHRLAEAWRSGILTSDHLELALIQCERCGRGQWRMVSRVPEVLVIE